METQCQREKVSDFVSLSCVAYISVYYNLSSLNIFVFRSKELKDPDLLYNILKNLLAQIKVRPFFTPLGPMSI